MELQNTAGIQKITPIDEVLPALDWPAEEFGDDLTSEIERPLSLIEKLEAAYKELPGDAQEKKLYFDSQKYSNLSQQQGYNFRATFKTIEGWKTKSNLTQKLLNGLFEELGEKSAENRTKLKPKGTQNGFPVGVAFEVGENIVSERDVGFIIEVYNPRQSLNLMRIDEKGKMYFNDGKKPKLRKEIRYDGNSYLNAYTLRGKMSDLKRFQTLFGSNMKSMQIVEPNKSNRLN